MRIAILNLTGGGMSGGYYKYLRNVLPEIVSSHEVEKVLCVAPKAIDILQILALDRKIEYANCSSLAALTGWKDEKLCNTIRDFKPHVIFIPLARYIQFNNIPVVNMVQNMLPLVCSQKNTMSDSIRNLFRRVLAKHAVHRADKVIAISGYVRDYLVNNWGLDINKINVIYHGVSVDSSRLSTKYPKAVPYSWEKNFLFTAGSVDYYRGIEDVLNVIKHIDPEIARGVVVAGAARLNMEKYWNELMRWVRSNSLADRVCFVGHLKNEEMNWCYQNCFAFVMTSRVEACPNIVLEAMANGCINISTKNRPMPELFGDTALYYEAGDIKELSRRILDIAGWGIEAKEAFSQRAIQRAMEYTWQKCAQGTLETLKSVVK